MERVCSFSPFLNLVQLNLAHNEITDLLGLRLQTLPFLKNLDVSFNHIDYQMDSVCRQ